MNDHMHSVNMTALEAAVKSLVGERGFEILHELYLVIDAAETRGFNRGQEGKFQHGDDAYQRGWNDCDATWTPRDEDLRDPIINACVEGEFVDRSEGPPWEKEYDFEAVDEHLARLNGC